MSPSPSSTPAPATAPRRLQLEEDDEDMSVSDESRESQYRSSSKSSASFHPCESGVWSLAVTLLSASSISRYFNSRRGRCCQGCRVWRSSRLPESNSWSCGVTSSKPWVAMYPGTCGSYNTACCLDWQVGLAGGSAPWPLGAPPGQSSRMPLPDPSEIDLVGSVVY